jgi:hypothetical protein
MELNSEGMKVYMSAGFVKSIHISIIIYMSLGWILNNTIVWISILMFTPLFHIHWKTNDGKCMLTNLEKKLRNDETIQGTFIGDLSKTFLKKELKDSTVAKLAYGIMYSSAFICAIRYLLSTNIL